MLRFLPSLLLLLIILFVPDFVAAQATNSIAPGGFVTCEGAGCRACDLISMINRIIKWLFGIFFVLFAVLMTVAGFGLVTSGGNASALNEAKSKFNNALIGLLIMMSAWLVVDLVMRTLLKDDGQKINGYGPWSTVQCRAQTEVKPPKATTPSEGGVVVTPPPSTAVSCFGGDCVPLGIACSNPASCSISPKVLAQFQAFHAAVGISGARVTEAMPPTRAHIGTCHNNGTCIDYSKQGGMTASEVIKVINAANANGLRPVYEVGSALEKDALIKSGVPSGNILLINGWITAPHFSIYSDVK